ncbi:MAG: hypothetical protein M5U14_14235 [Acidimicrobiia bacterium]|nr:hypothetical protein [Acidimicrobiia bacterium]
MILAGALLLPGIVTLFSARSPGRLSLMAAGFTVALGAASGRVGFDSLVQRDGPDDLHGRAFARFETRFQLVWVAGALIPVAIPLGGRLGLFVLSLVLGFGGLSYIGALRASRDQEPVPERPSGLARLRSHRSRLERSRRSEVQPPRDPGEPPGPSTAAP